MPKRIFEIHPTGTRTSMPATWASALLLFVNRRAAEEQIYSLFHRKSSYSAQQSEMFRFYGRQRARSPRQYDLPGLLLLCDVVSPCCWNRNDRATLQTGPEPEQQEAESITRAILRVSNLSA